MPERVAGTRRRRDRLAIPGIGKDLAAKIGELVETGTRSPITRSCSRSSRRPSSTCSTCRASGRRPWRCSTSSSASGTLDDLERAAREGRLRTLKGMGAKKEALILKALEERARVAGRRLMAEAHETAAALVGGAARSMRPTPTSPSVGSLRRGCETCGDLDILAAGAPPSLMDAFTELPARRARPGPRRHQVERPARGAASRPTCGSCRARASAPPCSTSPARRRTTSRCAIARSSAASSSTNTGLFRDRRRPAGRRRDGGRHLRGARPRVRPAGAAREPRRDRGRRARARCPGCQRAGPARRSAHAHDRHRRPRRRRDDGAGRAGRRARATSRSPITARRWRWPTGSTSARARSTRARSPRAERPRLDGITRARRHRVRHPAGRHDGSRRRLPRRSSTSSSPRSIPAFNQDEAQMTDRLLRAIECPWVDVLGHPTGTADPQARAGYRVRLRPGVRRGRRRRRRRRDQQPDRPARSRRRARAAGPRSRGEADHRLRRALARRAGHLRWGVTVAATRLARAGRRAQHAAVDAFRAVA